MFLPKADYKFDAALHESSTIWIYGVKSPNDSINAGGLPEH